MAGVEDYSEFEGGGVMPNTVFPKGSDALDNSDILRLDAITGQHTDSRAPIDEYHWYGNLKPDLTAERQERNAKQQVQRRRNQAERNRYKESP